MVWNFDPRECIPSVIRAARNEIFRLPGSSLNSGVRQDDGTSRFSLTIEPDRYGIDRAETHCSGRRSGWSVIPFRAILLARRSMKIA